MFTRRRVGIFAGAFAEKLNIETAARRSMHISTDPIAALTAAFGQIGSTHGLGILPETARQIARLREAIARPGYPALRPRSGRSSFAKPCRGVSGSCTSPYRKEGRP